jgi:hypothetical protein
MQPSASSGLLPTFAFSFLERKEWRGVAFVEGEEEFDPLAVERE